LFASRARGDAALRPGRFQRGLRGPGGGLTWLRLGKGSLVGRCFREGNASSKSEIRRSKFERNPKSEIRNLVLSPGLSAAWICKYRPGTCDHRTEGHRISPFGFRPSDLGFSQLGSVAPAV